MNKETDRNELRFKLKPLRLAQAGLMLIAAFLLGAHVVKWDAVRVDSVSLILLGLLFLIPFADLIRKVKFGEFEAEIGKEEVAKAQAKVAVELASPTERNTLASEDIVRQLLREDPRLALAKVRIELEEALKRLYSATAELTPDWRRMSLGRIIDSLVQQEVLSGSIASALRDVMTLANRAVHGERVEPGAAEELAFLGVRLVREIQQANLESILHPIDSAVITRDEVDRYQAARYRVTTVVPLAENPTKNTYVFDQDALASFLEGHEEYAEFIVGIEKA
jgi:hypothetical protein